MIDLVIVSDAKFNKQLTVDCINTSKVDDIGLNIIVVESDKNVFYDDLNVKTLHYDFEFNYNACLNLGIRNSNLEYVALANNDLIFHKNWANNLLKFFERDENLMSASSVCGILHGTSNFNDEIIIGDSMIADDSFPKLCGWFIFQRRKIYNIIGDWDENFKFWYSDDDYRQKLRINNIKHGLVLSSRVDHLGSKTLSQIEKKLYQEYTEGGKAIYQKKYN